MKEISDFNLAQGVSLFLEVFKGLDANTPLSSFASNSGAMVAGYEGIVTAIDYQEVQGRNVTKLAADQIVRYKDAEGNAQELRLAKKGEMPKAPVFIFDGGNRNMTIGLLQQGQKKTTIKFPNGTTKTSTDLTLADLRSIAGLKWKCTSYFRDTDNIIRRYDADGKVSSENPANCYTIELSNV